MEWKTKWNYAPHYLGEVSAETKKTFDTAAIMDMYDVASLPWNEFETKAISQSLEVMNKLLNINYGLSPMDVNPSQIIIIDEVGYDEKVRDEENEGGKCSYGYIYIRRMVDDKPKFINDLVHELSHLFSFYSLLIKEDNTYMDINLYQLGYHVNEEKKKNIGLNEAATEMWAKKMIKEIIKSDLLTPEERNEALDLYSYPYHVILMQEILRMAHDPYLAILFEKSYFDGSSAFLKRLGQRLPGAKDILAPVDRTKDSVIDAAKKIGGKELMGKLLL